MKKHATSATTRSAPQQGKRDVPIRGLTVRHSVAPAPDAAEAETPGAGKSKGAMPGYVPGLDDDDGDETDPLASAAKGLFRSQRGAY